MGDSHPSRSPSCEVDPHSLDSARKRKIAQQLEVPRLVQHKAAYWTYRKSKVLKCRM